MSPQELIEMFTLVFNLIGLAICLVGLTLAQRMRHRWPGYAMAVAGFLVAALPLFYKMWLGMTA
ncbi:hypothetical protein [Billgrantia montanilacus]|jgi:hypothetical protein|uniref:Uncharacterized protein n=1 Tax=Billgrantia montanilacus TaxID=2282305 RepID=A0A368U131_9GAMM|nr:hypothetical protein [Halomonas montanilacus]RCV89772.1 hypothetical protein DU505_09250 [Halomonas montanilacus]